jgi:hypothetical protein
MVHVVRSAFLAAAVCVACLVATAIAFEHSQLNRTGSGGWQATSALLAAATLVGAGYLAHVSRLLIVELAAAAVAGGLVANSLVSGSCGGVADFVSAGAWIYSPGDLAMLGGTVLLALGTATAAIRAR